MMPDSFPAGEKAAVKDPFHSRACRLSIIFRMMMMG